MKTITSILIAELFFLIIASIPATATIVVLVSTYDGFVIAADSRLTLASKDRDRIASDSYQKIVRIGQASALAFAGVGLLVDESDQSRSIGSLVEAFKIHEKISDSTHVSPKIVVDRLKKYFEQIYNSHLDNALQGELNIIVFGYDELSNRKLYEIDFPNIVKSAKGDPKIFGTANERYSSGTTGSYVLGQRDVFQRIVKGYDPLLSDLSFSEGLKDSLRYDIRYDIMTLQDGIDFAVFIARATIEAQRFNQKSVMGVGGEIDVATITTRGFEWIQKKELNVEGKESDHKK
ncbi:MAG: hypothetical protein NTV54_08535 [Ignavibacteriales bacterium]|nr:hypothetical protein [Ignavibacteriales bacterium]